MLVTLNFNHNGLAEHGAQFAAGGGDAVEGAAIAGWEGFGRYLKHPVRKKGGSNRGQHRKISQ